MNNAENGGQAARKKAAGKKGASRGTALAVRVVVYGLVAVAAVLVWLEVRARGQRNDTLAAWQNELRERGSDVAGEERELHRSQLGEFVVGSPTVSGEQPSDRGDLAARTMRIYTWSGPLRRYSAVVHFGLGDDPAVEMVEDPAARESE